MMEPAPQVPAQCSSTKPVREPEAGEGETMLFQAEGVLVTSERLVAAGRTWWLGDVEQVETIRRAPRVLPLLVTLMVGGVLGLPVLLAAMAAASSQGRWLYESAMVVTEVAMFGSIVGLVSMGDTSWLVLRMQRNKRRVLHSRDHELICSLAAVVSAAVARQRR